MLLLIGGIFIIADPVGYDQAGASRPLSALLASSRFHTKR